MNALVWYALRSKPHKESFVYQQLLANNIEAYYPMLKVKPINPRSSSIRSFFPGYMFVRLDLENSPMAITQWLPGTIGLVQFDGIPGPVPDGFIVELKRRLKTLEEAGGMMLSELRQGDQVHIVSGAMEGYDAVFDARLNGTQRVQILLDIMGRWVRAEVDVNNLRKKKSNPSEN